MNDIEFIQKAQNIFGKHSNEALICRDPEHLYLKGYFSQSILIEIAIELIKLEANVRDELVRELTC